MCKKLKYVNKKKLKKKIIQENLIHKKFVISMFLAAIYYRYIIDFKMGKIEFVCSKN